MTDIPIRKVDPDAERKAQWAYETQQALVWLELFVPSLRGNPVFQMQKDDATAELALALEAM